MQAIFDLLNYPLSIFIRILDKTDTFSFYIGMFSIFCIYRFLIKPLAGGRSISTNETKVRDKNKGGVVDE